jgi:hypothetical protein
VTDAAVVEAALRTYLGAGTLIDRIHDRNQDVSDGDVLELAYQELDAYRSKRKAG